MAFINKIKDVVQRDIMWRVYIEKEDDAPYNWKANWGWTMDEYACLKKKMDEKTATSAYLSSVTPPKIIDERKLPPVPESTNHMYGWVADQKDFRLEKYGPDFFKSLPLPSQYLIFKEF